MVRSFLGEMSTEPSTSAHKFRKQELRIMRIGNHECIRIDTNKEERVHEKHERHEKEQSSPFRVFSCLPWTKNSCGCVVKTIPEPTRAQNPETEFIDSFNAARAKLWVASNVSMRYAQAY